MKRDSLLVHNVVRIQNLLESSLENEIYEQIWKVIPLSVPKIIRKCSRCNGDKFYSSDKFRVNANKKVIDAWLIYKCSQCKFSSKNSIISRTPISKIDRSLFKRLQENDKTLAWQYAFDPNFMQKNMQMDWNIDFDIQVKFGHNVNSVHECNNAKMHIMIRADYFLKIPIVRILKNKMEISRNQLEKMHQRGDIEVYNLKGDNLTLKANLGKGCVCRIIDSSN